jgi:hypothetical protein
LHVTHDYLLKIAGEFNQPAPTSVAATIATLFTAHRIRDKTERRAPTHAAVIPSATHACIPAAM